jgi:outer membrane protein assembly factor BamE (lipoprotein component of BamABCDE complex)
MKKKFRILIQLLILSLCLFSCTEKFDSQKWKQKGVDWQISELRENMIDDLISSNILKGKDSIQVLKLLGEPEQTKGNLNYYLIREKYSIDIDPEYISYLVIEFDKNKKVKNYYQERTK